MIQGITIKNKTPNTYMYQFSCLNEKIMAVKLILCTKLYKNKLN